MPNLSKESSPLHGPTPEEITAANGGHGTWENRISSVFNKRVIVRGSAVAGGAVAALGGVDLIATVVQRIPIVREVDQSFLDHIKQTGIAEADCGSSNPNYICPKNAPERPPTGPNIPGGYPTITTSVLTPGNGVLNVDAFEDLNYDGVRQLPTEGRGLVADITVFNQNGSLDAKTTLSGNGANMGLSAGIKRVCAALAESLTRFTTYGGGQCVDNVVVPAGGTVTVLFGETSAPGYLVPQIPNVPTIVPGTRLPGPENPTVKPHAVPTVPEKPRILAPTGLSSPNFEIEIQEYLPYEAMSASSRVVDFSIVRGNKQVLGAQVVEALPIRGVRYGGVIHDVESFDITRDLNKVSQVQLGNLKFLQGHDVIHQVGKGVMYGISNVKNGDIVNLNMGDGKVLQYKVDFVGVVGDYEAYLNQHSSEDAVVGLTCTGKDPVYSNDRLVFHAVRAAQAVPTATAGQAKAENGGQTKNDFRSAIGGLAVLLLAGLGVYAVGKRN